LPLELFRRTENGGREAAKDHPLYRILAHAPNEWQPPLEFREQSQMSAGTRGNSYSIIGRDPDGTVTGLYPLSCETVQVM
ncbi:phage portal protein, partial [Listeria monocytogenes]|nr:phage portal protein [Listeria monocytogenes]